MFWINIRIGAGSKIGFIAIMASEVGARMSVQIVEVTQANRHALPAQIAAWVKERRAQANVLLR